MKPLLALAVLLLVCSCNQPPRPTIQVAIKHPSPAPPEDKRPKPWHDMTGLEKHTFCEQGGDDLEFNKKYPECLVIVGQGWPTLEENEDRFERGVRGAPCWYSQFRQAVRCKDLDGNVTSPPDKQNDRYLMGKGCWYSLAHKVVECRDKDDKIWTPPNMYEGYVQQLKNEAMNGKK